MRAILYIGILLSTVFCSCHDLRLHPGDLLFAAGETNDMTGAITAATGVAQTVARAKRSLGLPYDYSFLPANGKLYCSELIWENYLAPNGTHLFSARPMNFRAADGTMPAFCQELFDDLGKPVPEGVPGTNPNDMAREPILENVFNYYSK